jgi:hypothetical protein
LKPTQTKIYATIAENLVTATKKVVGLARFKTPFFPSPTFKEFICMLNRKRVLGILILLASLAAISYADQPRMQAARTNLQQARAQLQGALRNKGGHRAQAIGYINSAISEVDAGIRFDRHNHHALLALATSPDQPRMQRALELLRDAKSNLEAATSDKGGHRVRAIAYVNNAIDEVKKGIDAGE